MDLTAALNEAKQTNIKSVVVKKPANHHCSGYFSPINLGKWYCTLVYNESNGYMGIAVLGKEGQFCRRVGGSIALSRTLNGPFTAGQYSRKMESEEEIKQLLSEFRSAIYYTQLLELLEKYFPNFRPHLYPESFYGLETRVKRG